jgi:hypothetical protein
LAETPLDGVLKGDWVVVADAGKRRARCADIVRTPDGLRLGDALMTAARAGVEPFNHMRKEVSATVRSLSKIKIRERAREAAAKLAEANSTESTEPEAAAPAAAAVKKA